MNLFFDNMLSPALAKAFEAFLPCAAPGVVKRVEHLRSMFPLDTTDERWMNELSDNVWVIITADVRIRRSYACRQAWVANRHVVFFLGAKWSTLKPFAQLERMARRMPIMLELARTAERPCGFMVPVDSRRIEPVNVHSER